MVRGVTGLGPRRHMPNVQPKAAAKQCTGPWRAVWYVII